MKINSSCIHSQTTCNIGHDKWMILKLSIVSNCQLLSASHQSAYVGNSGRLVGIDDISWEQHPTIPMIPVTKEYGVIFEAKRRIWLQTVREFGIRIFWIELQDDWIEISEISDLFGSSKDLNLNLIGWNVETRRCRNFNCCPGPMLDVRSWTWRFWFVSFLVWEKWGVGKRMHASHINWEIFWGWEVEHWWTCTFFRVKKCFSQIFCEDYWQESRNHELWMIRICVFISNGCMAITSETYLSKGLAMQSGVSRYESIWIYMVHHAFITTWKSFCTIYDIWSTCSSLNWSIFGRSWTQKSWNMQFTVFFSLTKK